jgi:hypothetical protein
MAEEILVQLKVRLSLKSQQQLIKSVILDLLLTPGSNLLRMSGHLPAQIKVKGENIYFFLQVLREISQMVILFFNQIPQK